MPGDGSGQGPAIHFCELATIENFAERIGRELDSQMREQLCDTDCAAVREGILVKLLSLSDGKCPKCGIIPKKMLDMKDVAICPHCHGFCSTRDSDDERWFLSERGMAEFVARKLANRWAQPASGLYHLGSVGNRDLYFGIRPSKLFFTYHGSNVSIVLAGGDADIPDGWKGAAATLSELFFYDQSRDEIRIAPNIKERILPGKGLKRGRNRVIHERRDEWLRFITDLLSKQFKSSDFYKGKIRQSVVAAWFKKNIPGAPKSSKTYKRDYEFFKTYVPGKDSADYREPLIIMLLRYAANPRCSQAERERTARRITDIRLYLRREADKNFGHEVDIPNHEWQYTGDKQGTRELVPVSHYTEQKIEAMSW